ncbi:MAG TPA: APC family permease [Paraburkholderia sp.]
MNTLIDSNEGAATPAFGATAGESGPARLSGQLGMLEIVFTVLAYNAPLTVVTGMGVMITLGNGLGSPVTYLVAGALILIFAVGFTTMSKHVPNAGAFYAYIAVGIGRPLGLGSALMAMLAYGFMMVGLYLYAGIVYASLVRHLFNAEPLAWWGYSVILLAAVGLFGYLRITFSARVLTIALVCEVLIVFVWEIVVAVAKGAAVLSPSWLTPGAVTSGSVALALLFGVTCFAGFEATVVFREEARDPEVTVPRATYCAILAMAVLFCSSSYFLICAYGPRLVMEKAAADPSMVSLNAIGLYLGKAGLETVNALLCSSVFACLLALHNILSRYIYCLGLDGTLPRALSTVHARHGSPHRASVVVTSLMLVIVIGMIKSGVKPFATFAVLTGVGGYCLLLLLILTSLSVLIYFARDAKGENFWRTKLAPAISFLIFSFVGGLATVSMKILTGNVTVAESLIAVVFGTLAIGVLYAQHLKKAKPEIYLAIGRQVI